MNAVSEYHRMQSAQVQSLLKGEGFRFEEYQGRDYGGRLLQRQSRVLKSLPAAIERDGVRVAHLLEIVCN